MTRTKSTILTMLAVLLLPMAANGDVIWDEGTSGDIDNNAFDFSAGMNEIVGRLIYTEVDIDFDEFSFNLADGARLVSVTYSVFDIDLLPGETFLGSELRIRTGDDDPANQCTLNSDFIAINVAAGPGFEVYSDCASTSGTITGFDFEGSIWQWDHNVARAGPGGSWGYSLAFDVDAASVPEPGSLALLGIGLLGMGLARRNRKALS